MKYDVGGGGENIDLIVVLAHELGVALEMSYNPTELRELWSEALVALKQAKAAIESKGIPAPAVVENVIKLSEC